MWKVFVRGHVYEFLPKAICEYLNISFRENFNFEKEYVLDDVAIELLGHKCVRPKTNILRVANLTLKYNGLHKIALRTSRLLNIFTFSRDFATLFIDIGIVSSVHLG